jgi:hypothetical protein
LRWWRWAEAKLSVQGPSGCSPQKRLLSIPESSDGVHKLSKALGIPKLGNRVAQKLVRAEVAPNDATIVLEYHLLSQFLAQCKEVDKNGLYEVVSTELEYNGALQSTLRYWAVSFGAVKQMLVETDILHLVAFDSGHWCNTFGGVLFAAITAHANRGLLPVLVGGALVENTERFAHIWFDLLFVSYRLVLVKCGLLHKLDSTAFCWSSPHLD